MRAWRWHLKQWFRTWFLSWHFHGRWPIVRNCEMDRRYLEARIWSLEKANRRLKDNFAMLALRLALRDIEEFEAQKKEVRDASRTA